MGIFAKGSQFPATVEVDTPQNRYGGQFTKDSAAGDALGEVISDVNSTAESANTTAGEIIADIESLEGRVTTLENDPGPDLSGLDSYGGYKDSSVSVDTLLAGGTNSNSRAYYRVANGGDTPDGGAGVLDVTNTGYMFTQVFYGTTYGGIYQRTITDRSHIVPGQWVYGDWVKVLNEGDLSGYAETSRVSTLEGRVATLEGVSSTSGTGWQAWRRSGVTTLTFNGVTEGFTLPAGYRPPGLIYGAFSYARDSVGARFNILSNGTVELIGDIPTPAFGTVTFVSAN